MRVGVMGGLARSLEDSPRQGGLGSLRARFEHCEDGFICAVNLSLISGYGLKQAGGFQQWLTLDLGMRFDPIAVYSSVGFSGLIVDMDRESLNVSYFSPRAGAGMRFDAGDFSILAEGHVSYLWRWFGENLPVAGIEIGLLIPFGSGSGSVAVATPPPPTNGGPVQVVQ
ncbi:MAG: hypothetical protein HYY06_25470 [Deltaproteobacteria bacterium]|nr:hypothetical protein [Deltaproteobacteria bacterium]